jgi:hypothetical protein
MINAKTMLVATFDTFGGEANYSWVRQEMVTLDKPISELAAVRRAKKIAGFTGVRCEKADYGDAIQLDPAGYCVRILVSFE